MKVACYTIYPAEAPSVYHRIYAYKKLFEEQSVHLDINSFMTSGFYNYRKKEGGLATLVKVGWMIICSLRLLISLGKVRRYDVVIIHREVYPLGRPWVEKLIARLSHCSIYDLDDAIWFPPSTKVNQRSMFWYEPRIKEIMSSCSWLVVGNAFINRYAQLHNANVTVISTPYDDLNPGFARTSGPEQKIFITWIGNLGNAEYLQVLLPVFEYLAKKYPIILRLIGGADIRSIAFGNVPVQLCEWNRGMERDWLLGSDIGIMPLYDQEYEQGKCAFKLIQYFSAGLPVVASPVGMNKDVVLPNVNGYQATNIAEWTNALESLICEPALRQNLGKNGYALFKSHFTRAHCARLWLKVIKDAIEKSAS
jgi:glycosyltransferase involved in cell wall biosynthesis